MTELRSVRSFPLVNGKRILPEGVVYIGRAVPRVGLKASPWANPYRVGHDGPGGWPKASHMTINLVLQWYRSWLESKVRPFPHGEGHTDFVEQLRGQMLACWCPPERCHGDVLLEWLETHPILPAVGAPIEFGLHRLSTFEAEEAPAWPSLASVRASADAKFRREQRKVRA